MITILIIAVTAVLLVSLWPSILEFFNGPVRDLLERLFGADKCGWYTKFLNWLDGKMCDIRKPVKKFWNKFKDTVISVKSRYVKNADGTYSKSTETIVRKNQTTAKRVVIEETVGWEYLPDSVREEMLTRRVKEAELDDRALVEEKYRKRAEEDGISLSA